MAAPTQAAPTATSSPVRVHSRHRPARRDLPGGRLDDRLGDLHRLGRHRPAGVVVGTRGAAAGLGDHRRDDGHRRPGLRRAGGHDAQGGRAVRLSAGGTLAGGRISLRLDPLHRHPDRDHRGGRGGVCPVPRRPRTRRHARRLPSARPGSPAGGRGRDPARPLAPASGGDGHDRRAHRPQHPGGQAGCGHPDRLQRCQDRRARGPGAPRAHALPPAGCCRRQLFQLLGHRRLDPGGPAGDRRGHGRARSSPATRGTTSPLRRPRSGTRPGIFRARSRSGPDWSVRCTSWPTSPT